MKTKPFTTETQSHRENRLGYSAKVTIPVSSSGYGVGLIRLNPNPLDEYRNGHRYLNPNTMNRSGVRSLCASVTLWFIILCGFAVSAFAQQKEYDFGDSSSTLLTSKAWEALKEKDYDSVLAYTQRCISFYLEKAKAQQASLSDFASPDEAFDYWALNDVATCYFIKGSALKQQDRLEEARVMFETIINELNFAQCWDPLKERFWKVSEAANDMFNILGTDYDFGDYTSQTLTVNAWKALDNRDYRAVELYAKRCIELYSKEAEKQQGLLGDYPSQDEVFNYWALNDVATSHFILGEALAAQKRYKEAKYNFNAVVNNYVYAQCWDPQGWFWSVASASRERLNELRAKE